jgi:hypothetical protein
MKTLKKNKKEMLELEKNTANGVKNAFDEYIIN